MSRRRSEALPKGARVRRRGDYVRAGREGRRFGIEGFVILVRPTGGGRPRLGVTVSTKVSGAVGRNRIRRVVREVFRRNQELFPPQSDVVFIARPGEVDADAIGYGALRQRIERLARRWTAPWAGSPSQPRSS